MRELTASEKPRAGEVVVKLRNNTAHLTHLSLRDGAFLTLPPTVGDAVAIALTAAEKIAFDRTWDSPAVKAWVAAGDVVLETADDSAPPTPAAPPAAPPADPPPATEPPLEPPPALDDDDDI